MMSKADAERVAEAIRCIESGKVEVGVVMLRDAMREAGHAPPVPVRLASQDRQEGVE